MNISKNYPRPQFYRDNWESLNGKWSFIFDEKDQGNKEKWEIKFPENSLKINVPFSYETIKSGINIKKMEKIVWYQRDYEVSNIEEKKNVFLHLEASDFYTKIYINGIFVKEHKGGNVRITVNIVSFLKQGINSIVFRVEDSNSTSQLLGKQKWIKNNFGCWYLQTTGIWKSVWIEWTNKKAYIDSIKITPNLKKSEISLIVNTINTNRDYKLILTILYENKIVTRLSNDCIKENLELSINIENTDICEWGIKEWSPTTPYLYDLEIRLEKEDQQIDKIISYFGMREIEIINKSIFLNGRILYQKLLLDQGYWSNSNLTPPSFESLEKDIEYTKKMGFNGIRKHQKIEDERFYYLCDKKGLLVWAEAPSTYSFNDLMVNNFVQEWLKIVTLLYNHPSIITWTPINESWGVMSIRTDKKQQSFSKMIYYLTKSIDSTRPVIVNDGWEHTISDIITLHDYEENPDNINKKYNILLNDILNNNISHNEIKLAFSEGNSYNNQPIVISEFGGIALKNSNKQNWGYGKQEENKNDFYLRLKNTIQEIRKLPFICGYCYTQLSDVQQEINGLLTENREPKIELEKIALLNS